MSSIDEDVVLHVARLARIRLDDDECAQLRTELGRLLEHFAELESVDTGGVDPTFHTVDAAQLRPDMRLEKTVASERLREAAPQLVDDAFAVPKVLE